MANFLKSLFVKGIEIDPAGATSNQVLKYNGTKFVPGTASTVGSIDDLTDVIITSPLEYESLVYNGTNWVNQYASNATYVRNAEATTLTTGTVVYLFGATGDHATVKRADNDSDTTSAKTVGLVASPIAASENGPVVTRGYVDGINLSTGYASGDILWLGEDGAFTKVKPTAPEHLVFIGVVVRATNNGIVYVATQNGYELDELHNVSVSSPTAGQVLTYNGSLWTAASAGGGSTITSSATAPVSPSAGQVWFDTTTGSSYIYYNSAWVELGGGSMSPMQATSSTRPSSPWTGQTIYETDTNRNLQYNGSAWVTTTPVSASATNQVSTTSGTFVSVTSDPAVSLQTGTSALVTLSVRGVGLTSAGYRYTCFAVSGATTRAASGNETNGVTNYYGSGDLGNDRQGASTWLVTGLTAGVNTFTMQHATAGNYTVTGRSITVVGIP